MFEKKVYYSEFLSPLKDFQREKQPIEYRRDSLTGIECRINLKRSERVKQGEKSSSYPELIAKSKEKCFFCQERIKETTPRFPPEISSDDRITYGDTYVFPNLFPFAQHHAVATVTREHFKEIDKFTTTEIIDMIKASLTYFRQVNKYDRKAKYPSFNWNHLPPSGASIVHPHVQLLVDNRPSYLTNLFLEVSKNFWKKKRRNYWEELIKHEKDSERFIAQIGSISWFTSFAPIGNNEVNAVFQDRGCISDLTDDEITSFVEGLQKILKGYYKMGVRSFNLTSYSSAIGEREKNFWLSVKIISRPTPQTYYTSDAGFMEILHRVRIVETIPETVAKHLRREF